ncbi:MAG: DNA translocase FtsK [Pyrinomonadaceae bacterium]
MAAEVKKKENASNAHSRTNEIVAVGIAALTVLLFLCLVSYNANDPVLFFNSSSFKTQNWIGVAGATAATILFNIIGLATYFLPFLMGLIAWRVSRSGNFYAPVSRIIGYLLFVVSTSGMFGLFAGSDSKGGLVGAFLAQAFNALIGKLGSGILLTALFLTSVLLITNLSYFSIFDSFPLVFGHLKIYFEKWRERYRAWRETQKQASAARMEKRLEARNEREFSAQENAKKPTISLGDTATATQNSLNKKSKNAAENLSDAAVLPESASETETPKEILPTIASADKIPKTSLDKEDEFEVLNEDSAPIPISPMKQTGDLEKILLAPLPVEEAKFEPTAKTNSPPNYDNYILPTPEFLTESPPPTEHKEEQLLLIAQELVVKTKEFNATGTVKHISPGPVVTTYEFKPDPGVKYSRITGLADDLCLALKAESIRIDRIPGKAHVGIEVPNPMRDTIFLREVIESTKFKTSESKLTIALGKSIDGLNYVADLAKMPHLLIAGATGAGKSVGVNTLIVSILYKAKPDEVKFILVDPKQVELGIYADIPHLATPIITDPKRASNSLKWAVAQMEKRYKDLAGWGVRNIDGYNAEVEKRNAAEHFDDNGETWKKLPFIVIIIDELADLMMVSGKEVEESITRLAQMARAVGIHLVLATQRPSVDVITGLIKANFPARISFRVSSKVDSRTIIDGNGAERLLGRGDMLFLPPATSQIVRVHGAYVDEKEITKIVEYIKGQGKPEYDTTITKTEDELIDVEDLPGRRDPLFVDALRTVVSSKSASTSLLQRHLRIGYGRAAAILDAMVREGYIGEMDGSKRARPILQKAYDALQEAEEGREL